MKRQIESRLLEWKKSSRRKPLLIRGARQVGKTHTIQEFGRRHFGNVAVIDLERNPAWHAVFKRDLDPRRICGELEILTNQAVTPGSTLLFIDEIQECPRALMSLRYFYEEIPELHVIAAGSLLEFIMGDVSFPVGRVTSLTLRPLNFAEYLQAIGKERQMDLILDVPRDLSPSLHEQLLDELKRYFFIGGMPECVKTYAATRSLAEAYKIQADICNSYRADFGKYKPRANMALLNQILSAAVQSVGEQTKYAHLAEGYRNAAIKEGYNLLCMADVTHKVSSVNPTGFPLGATASDKIFKTIMLDVGLMRCWAGVPSDMEYSKTDLLDIYRGAMADQFVGQELLAAHDRELYCWIRKMTAKSSTAEVEYLLEKNGEVHPVEVKSGATGRLRSIQRFLEDYDLSGDGLVFSMRPFQRIPEKRLVMLPLYYVQAATTHL